MNNRRESAEALPPPENEKWYQKISVEPTMFLYMMAFMLTTVVEQVFFVYKACTVNHGYPHDICINIEEHQDIKKEVQITVSNFQQWNSIASNIVPICLALFLGAWSDRRGRKLPLILGLTGKFIYSTMVVVITTQKDWPVEYIIYTATIPSVLTGADVAIFASAFAYISDVSCVKDRTMRITILEACYLSTMPTGVALGAYLFSVTNKSFTIMFAINATLLLLSILYSVFNLKPQTTPEQTSISELRWWQIPGDFFDKNHVVLSLTTLFKKRTMHRRTYLFILMIAMSFYTFQRDEKSKMFLYTQLKFNWDANKYSHFKTFQSSAYVVMMLLGIPFMTKVLKWRDTVIVMIGASAHAIGRVFFVFADVWWWMYVGAAVAGLGPIVAPVLRSMVSKIVPITERGIIFAFLSVFDNAVPLFSGILYTQVYNASINTYPAAVFWLTFSTQVVVFILILCVQISLRGRTFEETVTEKKDAFIEPIAPASENGSQTNICSKA